jgi:hypothetical protein
VIRIVDDVVMQAGLASETDARSWVSTNLVTRDATGAVISR